MIQQSGYKSVNLPLSYVSAGQFCSHTHARYADFSVAACRSIISMFFTLPNPNALFILGYLLLNIWLTIH
jgi:hypothetical protein